MFVAKALVVLAAAAASATPLSPRSAYANCGSNGGKIAIGLTKDQLQDVPNGPSMFGQPYPREFKKTEGIKLRQVCAGQSPLMEIPVYADGHEYDILHGEDPGQARAVYTQDTLELCAIVSESEDGSVHQCP